MAPAPRVAVVLVNFNGWPFIADALQSLRRQVRPADEIIVVDNASADGSAARIAEQFPEVKLVRLPVNSGFAEGCNVGLDAAGCDYVALLNTDAVAAPEWLAALITALEADPKIAVTEGKIYIASRPTIIEQAGACFNNLGHYWGRGIGEPDRGQFAEITEVPGVTGCAMLLRREALAGSPLFDRTLFMYGEELDLTLRLRAAGWRIVYTPHAVVHHGGMRSVQRTGVSPRTFQQSHANRNRLKLLAKYYPAAILLRSLPLIIASYAYWNVEFLRTEGRQFAMGAVRQQLAFGLAGLRERNKTVIRAAERWTTWMTTHSLPDVLTQARKTGGRT